MFLKGVHVQWNPPPFFYEHFILTWTKAQSVIWLFKDPIYITSLLIFVSSCMYWYKFFLPASPLEEDYSTPVQVSLLFQETVN